MLFKKSNTLTLYYVLKCVLQAMGWYSALAIQYLGQCLCISYVIFGEGPPARNWGPLAPRLLYMNLRTFKYEVEGRELGGGKAHFLGHLMRRIRHDRALGIFSILYKSTDLLEKIQVYLKKYFCSRKIWKSFLEKYRFTRENKF